MVPQSFQQQINRELERFFQEKIKSVASSDSRLKNLIEQITIVTLSGGKRLRPYFCWLGYQVGGGRDFKKILPGLLALELTHSFALIHDDIIDKADTRHHISTIHAYFTQNLRIRQLADLQAQHLGQSLAILAGDLCLVWAEELMDKVEMSSWREPGILGRPIGSRPNHLNPTGFYRGALSLPLQNDSFFKAKYLYHQMLAELAFGQILDTWGMQGKTSQEILSMYQQKSGNYSVEKPLLIGASLAGAQPDVVKRLSIYGQKIGLAFQIQDDILGVFGKEKMTGKSTLSDIEEDKWTVLISFTYEKLNSMEKQEFLKKFKKYHKTQADIKNIKQQIVNSNSLKIANELMVELSNEAINVISVLKSENRKKLKDIAVWIISRRL